VIRSRAILGGISEAAKNNVIRGEDRVMNWPNGVALWIDHRDIDGLRRGNPLRRLETGKGIHSEGEKAKNTRSTSFSIFNSTFSTLGR